MINRDEVRRRLQEGKTPAEIAAVMNCSVGTIRRAKKELQEGGVTMDYKNPEGYADPTAYHAMKGPKIEPAPGDVWKVYRCPEGSLYYLLLQVYDGSVLGLLLDELDDDISDFDEIITIKSGKWVTDCRCIDWDSSIWDGYDDPEKIGEIPIRRLINIRAKVASIILRGYPDNKPALATEKAPRSDSKPELDKIPTEEEKPQETAGNTLEQDDAIRAVLQYKAASLEALTTRLLDIVEKAVQKGA